MTRRRAACVLAVAALVGVASPLWLPGPRPGLSTFKRVRPGMTGPEVAAAVGGPPGNYATRKVYNLRWLCGSGQIEPDSDRWVCDEGELVVTFEANVVVEVRVEEVRLVPESNLWERVRDWVKR